MLNNNLTKFMYLKFFKLRRLFVKSNFFVAKAFTYFKRKSNIFDTLVMKNRNNYLLKVLTLFYIV